MNALSTPHSPDDDEALSRCAEGEIGGLDILVARYQLTAIRTAYLLLQDQAAAEDVVQESFLLVFRHAGQFRPGAPFAPWFCRIVLNCARQYQRAARRRRETSLDRIGTLGTPGARTPVGSDPLRAAERGERQQAVARVLAALTHKQREVLVLRFYGGYSDGEIARILACPGGTVRWRLHAALRAFERAALRTCPWLLDDAGAGSGGRLNRERARIMQAAQDAAPVGQDIEGGRAG